MILSEKLKHVFFSLVLHRDFKFSFTWDERAIIFNKILVVVNLKPVAEAWTNLDEACGVCLAYRFFFSKSHL